jgi:TPR repeat protein
MWFTTLKEITNKYELIFTAKDNKYKREICDIFNDKVKPSYLKNKNLYNYIALYFQYKKKNIKQMKKYYLLAIKHNNLTSIINLGNYYNMNKQYDLMKKYYQMAIDKGDTKCLYYLGNYYKEIKDYTSMKKYYLKAIELGNHEAISAIAEYYFIIEDNNEITFKYLQMGLKLGDVTCIANLGDFYYHTKNYHLMKKTMNCQ